LELDSKEIEQAIQADQEKKRVQHEILCRENFKPYVFIVTPKISSCDARNYAIMSGSRRFKTIYIHEESNNLTLTQKFQKIGEIVRRHFEESEGVVPIGGAIREYIYCPTFDE
jgi:hypothetical protein